MSSMIPFSKGVLRFFLYLSLLFVVHNSYAKTETKPIFMAYYPTWFAPYHTAFCDPNALYYDYVSKAWLPCAPDAVLSDNTITSSSLLAGGIPDYVTHVVLAFAKLNQMHAYTGLSKKDGDLNALGLDLTPSSASVKESIRVLKNNNPGIKVLLALGGATFNESWKNVSEADINQAAQLIIDLGLDGLDVDYEVTGTSNDVIDEYYNSIVAMRKAVDQANVKKTDGRAILTVPGWSTGADCTPLTQGYPHSGCLSGDLSYFGGNAGRERLVFEKRGANALIDIVSIMSYDAGYDHFDPVRAYHNYKQIVKPGTPIALGIQPPPDEGWGSARTLVDDRGINNDCVGNTVLQDQYGYKTTGTFSVQRFAGIVKKVPGDGIMMWSLFASRPASTMCGSVKLSTVTELGQGVSRYLGIGTDRTKQIDYNTAINYGRR